MSPLFKKCISLRGLSVLGVLKTSTQSFPGNVIISWMKPKFELHSLCVLFPLDCPVLLCSPGEFFLLTRLTSAQDGMSFFDVSDFPRLNCSPICNSIILIILILKITYGTFCYIYIRHLMYVILTVVSF